MRLWDGTDWAWATVGFAAIVVCLVLMARWGVG